MTFEAVSFLFNLEILEKEWYEKGDCHAFCFILTHIIIGSIYDRKNTSREIISMLHY